MAQGSSLCCPSIQFFRRLLLGKEVGQPMQRRQVQPRVIKIEPPAPEPAPVASEAGSS
jgi:hypothetical protein